MVINKYVILANSNDKKFDLPRQLLEVNGETLIGRTIRLLKENGVKDILITASDERFKKYGEVYTPNSSDYNYGNGMGYWLNAFPYELLNEPVCFIWGDVYFSEEAIKTIVNTESKKDLFFCSYNNNDSRYIKPHDEPFAYKVMDTKNFKKHIEICKKAKDDGTACREPIIWEVYRSIHNQDINEHIMTEDYITINDITCDIDNKEDFDKLLIRLGGIEMIKVEAIDTFTLGRFNELINIERISKETPGKIFKGDKFECTKELSDYLLGKNAYRKAFVKVIEIIPAKTQNVEEPKKEDVKVETKKKKKKSKK